MPKRPDFAPIQTDRGWMISIPPTMSGDGKRRRKFYSSESEAMRAAKTLRASYAKGERGGVIAHGLALDAAAAAEILAPLGMTLTEAAKDVARRMAVSSDTETFRQRWVRAQVANEGRWSDRYADDMAQLWRRLPVWFMDRRCETLDDQTIHAAITEMGASAISTISEIKRRVSAILHYKERHRRSESIAIMTVSQCAAMLRACDGPEQRRVVALLLWAGIRPSAEDGEVTRLRWESVGASEIYVSREVSKTNTDRHIPITPRLKRLLRDHPASGPVLPSNWRRVYQRLRRAAGITEQDVTRHTFASHFLAAYGEHAAKQAMGHTEGSSTLFRHYRRAVTEAAGKRFFGVHDAKKPTPVRERAVGGDGIHPSIS